MQNQFKRSTNDNGFSCDLTLKGIGAFNNRWKMDRHKAARDHYTDWMADMVTYLFANERDFKGGQLVDGERDMVLSFYFKSERAALEFEANLKAAGRKTA